MKRDFSAAPSAGNHKAAIRRTSAELWILHSSQILASRNETPFSIDAVARVRQRVRKTSAQYHVAIQACV